MGKVMQTYVGHLQKFNCLRCNKIHRYYEPKISIYFSKSIYLLSHIKRKENFTSVRKFLGGLQVKFTHMTAGHVYDSNVKLQYMMILLVLITNVWYNYNCNA